MKKIYFTLITAVLLSSCGATVKNTNHMQGSSKEIKQIIQADNTDLYLVYHDQKINVFIDSKSYKKFLKFGDITYRRTFIGAGPNNKTIVYGLTKNDQSKNTNPAKEIMSGKLKVADNFYAEVFKQEEKRFYVFSTWNDFDSFIKKGIDNLRFSEIDTGPRGTTVIYILNKSNEQTKPTKAIARFKANHY